VDLRFTGDAWVVGHRDGTASVKLAGTSLARIPASPFDVPCLSGLLLGLRLWQARRRRPTILLRIR
jgi:hypothetical protein